MKKTKNNKKIIDSIDLTKVYEPIEAIKLLKDNSYVKFEETLEVAINLGIDSNKTEQNIRGVLNLPKGSGKNTRVAVVAKGDNATEAKEAGADIVGETDLIEKISANKIKDFAHKPLSLRVKLPVTSCLNSVTFINEVSITKLAFSLKSFIISFSSLIPSIRLVCIAKGCFLLVFVNL